MEPFTDNILLPPAFEVSRNVRKRNKDETTDFLRSRNFSRGSNAIILGTTSLAVLLAGHCAACRKFKLWKRKPVSDRGGVRVDGQTALPVSEKNEENKSFKPEMQEKTSLKHLLIKAPDLNDIANV